MFHAEDEDYWTDVYYWNTPDRPSASTAAPTSSACPTPSGRRPGARCATADPAPTWSSGGPAARGRPPTPRDADATDADPMQHRHPATRGTGRHDAPRACTAPGLRLAGLLAAPLSWLVVAYLGSCRCSSSPRSGPSTTSPARSCAAFTLENFPSCSPPGLPRRRRCARSASPTPVTVLCVAHRGAHGLLHGARGARRAGGRCWSRSCSRRCGRLPRQGRTPGARWCSRRRRIAWILQPFGSSPGLRRCRHRS